MSGTRTIVGRHWSQPKRRFKQGMDHLLEMPLGGGGVAVPGEYHFSLLGDLQIGQAGIVGAGEYSTIGGASTAPHGSAPAMEDYKLYPMRCRHPGNGLLRLVGLPGGRQVATV